MSYESEFLSIFLDEAEDTLERWERDCLELSQGGTQEPLLQSIFRHAHNLKGSARSVGLEDLGAFIHLSEDYITSLKCGETPLTGEAVALLGECQGALSAWTDGLRGDSSFRYDSREMELALSQILKRQGGPHTSSNAQENSLNSGSEVIWTEDIPSIAGQKNDLQNGGKETNPRSKVNSKLDETIRVPLSKVDALIRLSGELAIQSAILTNESQTRTPETSHSSQAAILIAKAVSDLQTEALSLRMQTVVSLFQRLERVASDAALSVGKSIAVDISGSDVELDKSVLERMKDPLVHLLRNAVDHGIETLEKRQELSKSAIARVTIAAKQSASSVIITISDDGCGLNKEKIISRAKSMRLIRDDLEPTEQEAYSLIFQPGFSTADKVTDISGRGVGMDVVKRTVEELGGAITIFSRKNEGTEFQIKIPSSLSILDALIINVNTTSYAVPIQDIDEVVHINSLPQETVGGSSTVINLRGQVIPLKRLSSFLPSNNSETPKTNERVAIVARSKQQTVAFEIDGIIGKQSIVIRKLDSKVKKVPGFSGGTIMQDGEPGMIINLPTILNQFSNTKFTESA